jgi:hypothetical protein
MSSVTRVGKSSQQIAAVRVDLILPAVDNWTPPMLVPEPMHVRGVRRWLDDGRPENVEEYASWAK